MLSTYWPKMETPTFSGVGQIICATPPLPVGFAPIWVLLALKS